MDQLAPFKPGEEDVREWLERFERWYKLSKKLNTDQADWCRLLIGKEADSSLRLVANDQPYDALRTVLIRELGETKPRETAARKLASLAKGTLTCRELARQAKYLAQTAFPGASAEIVGQQALDAFLRALPVTLRREVVRVEKKTLEEACIEALRQEALVEEEQGRAVKTVQGEEKTVLAIQPSVAGATGVCTCGARNRPPAARGSQACYECGEEGHYRRQCPKRKRPNKRPGLGPQPSWEELAGMMHYLMTRVQPATPRLPAAPPQLPPPRPAVASPPAPARKAVLALPAPPAPEDAMSENGEALNC